MTRTVRVPGQLLANAGRALYGEEWTGPLSGALGINQRAAQRWKAAAARGEDYQVSRSLVAEIAELLGARAGAMRTVSRQLVALAQREDYAP